MVLSFLVRLMANLAAQGILAVARMMAAGVLQPHANFEAKRFPAQVSTGVGTVGATRDWQLLSLRKMRVFGRGTTTA